MSLDLSVSAEGCCDGHAFNITTNINRMLREAGFPSWQMLDGLSADVVGLLMGRAVIELGKDPQRYRALQPDNGWGTYEGLIEWMREVLAVLDRHPTGIVRCST